MNLPNKLTVMRMALVPVFIVLFYLGNVPVDILDNAWIVESPDSVDNALIGLGYNIAAFVCFGVASLTDMLDGRIARKHGLETNFGKLMDPLADKILTVSAFIIFMDVGLVPAWAVIVIIAREFAITGLRGIAASEGEVIAAGRSGKFKTILQMSGILLMLIYCIFSILYTIYVWDYSGMFQPDMRFDLSGFASQAMNLSGVEGSLGWMSVIIGFLANICIYAAVVVTVYSGVEYLYKGRKFLNAK